LEKKRCIKEITLNRFNNVSLFSIDVSFFLCLLFCILTCLKKEDVKDAWLDNIDWANINSFKKSNVEDEKNEEVKPDTDKNQDESSDSDSDRESIYSQDSEETQIEVFKKIALLLKSGESVISAIKRYGKTSSVSHATNSSASMSASQRWLKKKNTNEPAQVSKEAQAIAAADKEALDKLTGYANYFIDRGYYDIYDETYDKLKTKIENFESKSNETKTKDPLDIFAEELDESDLNKQTDAPRTSESNSQTKNAEGKQFN
jgi:hypothetical protein